MSDVRLADLYNLAGALTLARFPLAVAFPFVADRPAWALGVYLAGIGTDVVDGWWARRTGTLSPAGAWADGIADKVFHLTVAFSLAWSGVIPGWWLPLWFTRELGQLFLGPWFIRRIRQAQKKERRADAVGKATTVLLGVTCIAAIAGPGEIAFGLTVLVALLGLVSIGRYAWREAQPA